MPILQNSQYEALALARARGARLRDAFEDAGFAPDRSHACRLAKRDDVDARIAELHAAREAAEESDPQTIIDALMRMARDKENPEDARVKEARLSLIEANRLRETLSEWRKVDRFQMTMGL